MATPDTALAPDTEISHYKILKTLSAGGFGIVYLARDLKTDTEIVLKEYMPGKLAVRLADGTVIPQGDKYSDHFNEGMRLFLQESQALSKLKHPNIVRVLNFFRENATAYMAMEYRPGKNLQSYIKKYNGNLSVTFLRTVFPQLLEGLKTVHDTGFLHLDIKPSNIHLLPGGIPLLLDFGAVHPRNESRKLQITQVITPGFSPPEQYDLSSGYVGPWTDLYALGATMRACIEGTSPTPADQRKEKDKMRPAVSAFKRKYPVVLLEAMDWAMEMDPLLRPQSADELLEAINQETPDNENLVDRLVNTLTKPIL